MSVRERVYWKNKFIKFSSSKVCHPNWLSPERNWGSEWCFLQQAVLMTTTKCCEESWVSWRWCEMYDHSVMKKLHLSRNDDFLGCQVFGGQVKWKPAHATPKNNVFHWIQDIHTKIASTKTFAYLFLLLIWHVRNALDKEIPGSGKIKKVKFSCSNTKL